MASLQESRLLSSISFLAGYSSCLLRTRSNLRRRSLVILVFRRRRYESGFVG